MKASSSLKGGGAAGVGQDTKLGWSMWGGYSLKRLELSSDLHKKIPSGIEMKRLVHGGNGEKNWGTKLRLHPWGPDPLMLGLDGRFI